MKKNGNRTVERGFSIISIFGIPDWHPAPTLAAYLPAAAAELHFSQELRGDSWAVTLRMQLAGGERMG